MLLGFMNFQLFHIAYCSTGNSKTNTVEQASCWLEQAKHSKTVYTITEEKKMFLIFKLACMNIYWDEM